MRSAGAPSDEERPPRLSESDHARGLGPAQAPGALRLGGCQRRASKDHMGDPTEIALIATLTGITNELDTAIALSLGPPLVELLKAEGVADAELKAQKFSSESRADILKDTEGVLNKLLRGLLNQALAGAGAGAGALLGGALISTNATESAETEGGAKGSLLAAAATRSMVSIEQQGGDKSANNSFKSNNSMTRSASGKVQRSVPTSPRPLPRPYRTTRT